eukprot:scaffold115846_cov63-Phaeocystis_antarctica.AAC.1
MRIVVTSTIAATIAGGMAHFLQPTAVLAGCLICRRGPPIALLGIGPAGKRKAARRRQKQRQTTATEERAQCPRSGSERVHGSCRCRCGLPVRSGALGIPPRGGARARPTDGCVSKTRSGPVLGAPKADGREKADCQPMGHMPRERSGCPLLAPTESRMPT